MNIKSSAKSKRQISIALTLPRVDVEELSESFWRTEEKVKQAASDGIEAVKDGWEATKHGAEKSKSGVVAGLQAAVPGLGLKHGKVWRKKFRDGTLETTNWSEHANLAIGVGQSAGLAAAAMAGVSLVGGFTGAAATFAKASLAGFGLAGVSGFALGTQYSEHKATEKAPNGADLVSFADVIRGGAIGGGAAAIPVVGLFASHAMFDTDTPYMGAGVMFGQLALFSALITGSSMSQAGAWAIGLGTLGGVVNTIVMNDKI